MNEMIVVFGKEAPLQERAAELKKVLDFYSPDHGYKLTSAVLVKKDNPDIDHFNDDNVMYADGCKMTFVQTTLIQTIVPRR